jgi:hypothetical protein
MKFTVPGTGSRRDAMRKRHRLHRIGAPMMRTRFPGVDSLQLDFTFSDRADFLPSPQVAVFHPPAPAYFHFICPYSDCDGEFNLSTQVDSALSSRAPQSSGQVRCTGARHGTDCTLSLEFSISPHWT